MLIKEILLDLLFPRECLGCQKEKTLLCIACLKSLKVEKLETPVTYIDRSLIACNYNNKLVADLIKSLKYHGLTIYAEILGDLLMQRLQLEDPPTFTLLPVPLHKFKQRRRGFNQSMLLAQRISSQLNFGIDNNLIRKKYTKSQTQLSRNERLNNLQGAFKYKGSVTKSILLIDDVLTTGQTLSEIAKELRLRGAQTIWSIVVAKNN